MPTGGAATCMGILYQLLGTLEQACNCELIEPRLKDDDLHVTTFVIEPQQGGDLIRQHGFTRRVQQWKKRSRPVGAATMIKEVLPDLIRAARQAAPQTSYSLETNQGPSTNCRKFIDLAQVVSGLSSTTSTFADGIAQLPEDTTLRIFRQKTKGFASVEYSHRGLFDAIRDYLISKNIVQLHETELLWNVLSSFKFNRQPSPEELRSRLDERVSPYLDDPAEARDTIDQLVGRLLRWAKNGSTKFTPKELLGQSWGDPLNPWGFCTARERLREKLSREVKRIVPSFDIDKNVRASPETMGTSIACLVGPSGIGKSWWLACEAIRRSCEGDSPPIVVLVANPASNTAMLQTCAQSVSMEGFNRSRALDLRVIARRLMHSGVESPWLSIFVDEPDNTTIREILRHDWERLGIEIAFSARRKPMSTAESLADESGVTVTQLAEFTADELEEFLTRNDHRLTWQSLPDDVRKLLRLPILARIYCETQQGGRWNPTNEYEIFDRYWRQLIGTRLYPYDDGRICRLATKVFLPDCRYPWPSSLLRDSSVDIDDAALARMIAAGILDFLDDRARFAEHSRIFNWVVARGLFHDFRDGRRSIDDFCQVLTRLERWPRVSGYDQHLGYVPMDALWMVLQQRAGDFSECLRKIEPGLEFYEQRALYARLHTLGSSVIKPIEERLAALEISENADWNTMHCCVEALIACFALDPTSGASWGAKHIRGDRELTRIVAFQILARFPTRVALENGLWQAVHELRSTRDQSTFFAEEYATEAFFACASLDADWLVPKILEQVEGETLLLLTQSVLHLKRQEIRRIWPRLRDWLMVPTVDDAVKNRTCWIVMYAGDSEATTWLVRQLENQRACQPALWALRQLLSGDEFSETIRTAGRLNPIARDALALALVPELIAQDKTWTDWLECRFADEENAGNFWFQFGMFNGYEQLIPRGILTEALGRVRNDLSSHASDVGLSLFTVALEILAGAATSDLLDVFDAVAQNWPLATNDLFGFYSKRFSVAWEWEKSVLGVCRSLLLRLGSIGDFRDHVLESLRSEDETLGVSAIPWSIAVSCDDVKNELFQIVVASVSDDAAFRVAGKPALLALAAMSGSESDRLRDALRVALEPRIGELHLLQGQLHVTQTHKQTMLNGLSEQDDQEFAVSSLLLALAAERAAAQAIVDALGESPSNQRRLAAATALYYMAADEPKCVEFLALLLDETDTRLANTARNALLRIHSAASLKALVRHDYPNGLDWRDSRKAALLSGLARQPDERANVAKLVWTLARSESSRMQLDFYDHYFSVLDEIPDARDFLKERAFSERTNLGSIIGLLGHEPNAAYEAAADKVKCSEDETEARGLARVMLQVDIERALEDLTSPHRVDNARSKDGGKKEELRLLGVSAAIGAVPDPTLLKGVLLKALSDLSPRRRALAAKLAGILRLCGDRLRELETTDDDPAVRSECRRAMKSLHDCSVEDALLSELSKPVADNKRRFVLADALMQMQSSKIARRRMRRKIADADKDHRELAAFAVCWRGLHHEENV